MFAEGVDVASPLVVECNTSHWPPQVYKYSTWSILCLNSFIRFNLQNIYKSVTKHLRARTPGIQDCSGLGKVWIQVRKDEATGSDEFVKTRLSAKSLKDTFLNRHNFGTTVPQNTTRQTFVKIQQGVHGSDGINRYDNICTGADD